MVLATLFLMATISIGMAGSMVQCDGSVPEWMIPSDYDNSGCVALRPFWEAYLPWNVGKTEMVCLGMCVE